MRRTRAPANGISPCRASGNPNRCAIAGDANIRRNQQLAAASQTVAVDGGDNWLDEIDLPTDGPRENRQIACGPDFPFVLGLPGSAEEGDALAEITASAEGLARAGHNDNADVRIAAEIVERVDQTTCHFSVDGVVSVGPVQSDFGDRSVS